MLCQDTEQPVAPHFQVIVRLVGQQIMQLARTDTRLAQPYTLDVAGYLFALHATLIGGAVALVVSLSADRQKLASPDDTQSFDLSLREDLPGRFFTIETP